MKIFVTGSSGFIGYHVAETLLEQGHEVAGYDSMNDYYDPWFKELRLKRLQSFEKFQFTKGLLEDQKSLEKTYKAFDPEYIVHLAAQAGVRYSVENPMAYIQANVIGFQNVIELVRFSKPKNFVFASTSSVYGNNKTLPFSESQTVRDPVSLYAVTKLSNELTARSYFNLFGLRSTALRFFTVYGPYGRPDMALFKFAKNIAGDKPIDVYNNGKMMRDFTFVDDIVSGIIGSMVHPVDSGVYNLGRGRSENLMDMISILEKSMGKKATFNFMPMQLGDVAATHADISLARQDFGYNPKTDISEGVPKFARWFQDIALSRT